MPAIKLIADRLILQSFLQTHCKNPQVTVRIHGHHLYVEIRDNGGSKRIIARATEARGDVYSASFRNHAARWDPLPLEGVIEEIAAGMGTLLSPFLNPHKPSTE